MNSNELRSLQEAYLEVANGQQLDEMIDPKGAARMDAAKKKKKVDVFAYDRKLQAQGKLKGKKLPPPPTNEEVESEAYEPMTKERQAKVDRAKKKAYDADKRAQYKRDYGEADKQFKRRMAMDSRTKMRKEELDIFDIVLSHLLDEGYADTIESAESIMINMSEKWRDSIVEAEGSLQRGRV